MRTTLNIDEEAMKAVKKHADDRGVSLGQAASDLIHRGAQNVPQFKMKNGWALLEAPGNPPLTNEMIEQWEQEDFDDEYKLAFSPRR